MACAMIRFYADLKLRDDEIATHAEWRTHLYDHDVVRQARTAAMELV